MASHDGSAAGAGGPARRPLPTGVVTFLFTDIEGSTKLVAEIGDAAYGAVLDTERALVLEAATVAGGVPFGSEGDAHFVAFSSAGAAIRGAVAAQRALETHPWAHGAVRVRMGIHTGEVQVVAEDYLGLEVHRAARVASAAHGGQVLVTETVRALAGELGDGITLVDLGEHRLKDLARPERLYQVAAPGLLESFPALRTLDATPNNLPPQLTSFVGRADVARAVGLLDRTRLLTLTGPGGTGKTRLSLAIAGDCVDRFPGGAWFVPLAAVTDPSLIASEIATAIGILTPNRPAIETVEDHLKDRAALLVLDNFEQVVSGAPVVGELLRALPKLTVIASSRAPLRIAGEQEFPVPPLTLPEPGTADPETLLASEAVRLFIERAMAVRPEFALTLGNAPHVTEIVRRLDGLPLAIELAAARIRLFTPAAMSERLSDRLALLGAGGRDLPERQRTLRGAIAWSYDLIEPQDRALFARAGVFAGGATLEAAETVCALPGDAEPLDVLDGLDRLGEQSLLRIGSDRHGDVRFAMLETIRDYALERLVERTEATVLRDRHADAFIALARLGDGPGALDRGTWLDRMADDHDNIRAALDHLVASADRQRAADLVHATWRFWQMRGHIVEGRRRVDAVLAMPGWTGHETIARLRALEAAGGLAYWAGDMQRASEDYEQAEAAARRLGDDRELANALYNRFFAQRSTSSPDAWIEGLVAEDQPFLTEALAIWTRVGDKAGRAKTLWALCEHHAYRRETVQAEAAATEALALFEELGDRFWVAWARFMRGFTRTIVRDVGGAADDVVAALAEFRQTNDLSGVALVLAAMSTILLLAGRLSDAYEMAGAARRAAADTGVQLATQWPGELFQAPDEDTTDPALRAALETGAAWTTEAATDRAQALGEELAKRQGSA